MVKHLATALQADLVYLGELSGTPSDRIRTLAVFEKCQTADNFEEELAGTAAGQVMADGVFLCSKDVLRIFPEDKQLKTGVEAYAGIRLCDSGGQPIGLLAIVSNHQILDIQLAKSVLETFAPRTAAELERKRIDDIHRENEERYHAFVSTNPDAMWRVSSTADTVKPPEDGSSIESTALDFWPMQPGPTTGWPAKVPSSWSVPADVIAPRTDSV